MKHPLRMTEALEYFGGKPRNPLGLLSHGGRVFAGGGDATPDWTSPYLKGEADGESKRPA